MDPHFSQFANRLRPSAIRAVTKAVHGKKNLISLAGGMPHPGTFPAAELRSLAAEILERQPIEALQYGQTQGYGPLIEEVIHYLAGRGIPGQKPENVLICSGSQQALDIAARIFIDPGDAVLTDTPGYTGAMSAFQHLGARLLGIPVLEDGPDLERTEAILKRERPKFFYVTPNFANPTGVLVSQAKRRALYDLAHRYDLWILEDDAYGELYFSEVSPAEVVPVKALDNDGRVIYLTTFSKTIAPSLRVAVIAAPAEFISKVELTKQTADMFTGVLPQMLACEFIRQGHFAKRLPGLRQLYQEKRDALDGALRQHLPDARWIRPKGGFFIWLELPSGIDAQEVFEQAMEDGVAFIPGAGFCLDGGGRSEARLSYSREPLDVLARGAEVLGKIASKSYAPNLR